MTCQVDPANQAAQPRQRTEAMFRVVEKQPSPAQLSPENPPQGRHALQAHQIKLELQNEALRQTQGELEVLRARYFSLLGAPLCLCLQVHLSDDEVNLEYRDDGPGYPEEILRGKRESGGLYLIETLVEHDLGGKVTFGNGPGAVARLHFALAPNGQPVSLQAARQETNLEVSQAFSGVHNMGIGR